MVIIPLDNQHLFDILAGASVSGGGVTDFSSKDDSRERADRCDQDAAYPKFDLSLHREIARERVVNINVKGVSPELVVSLFSSISPEITLVFEQHLLPALQSAQLFNPATMVSDYDSTSPYWIRQERTLFVGKGHLREVAHKVSLFDWDKNDLKPVWDVTRSRRRLNAFDVTMSFPDAGRDASWVLADRIGDALDLGSVRERLSRSAVDGQTQGDGSYSVEVVPGITVSTKRQETPEERAAIDRIRNERLRSKISWLPKAVEVSEPLYGEMKSALATLNSEYTPSLVDSGLLRYADRLVLEGDNVREEKLGQIAQKMAVGLPVVFGRSIALGKFVGPHPLQDGTFEEPRVSGEEVAFGNEEQDQPSQEIDSLTSVEINGVPSRSGECVVSFHSASQEIFAWGLHDAPLFDEDKPVLEVRFPELVGKPAEGEDLVRAELAGRICADIDAQLDLKGVVSEIERMGFEKGPHEGFAREAQYSRGKIKLTFEGA
jgi:hypothetical protein